MTDRLQPQFTAVLTLIKTAQSRVIATTNQELIQLYWAIGQYISDRVKTTEWGQKTIEQLATFIQTQEPGIKGFERRNLERMRQFYETYPDFPIASAVLTQLSWTHHYILISRCKTEEERLFHLQLAATDRYSTRELDRHSPRPHPLAPKTAPIVRPIGVVFTSAVSARLAQWHSSAHHPSLASSPANHPPVPQSHQSGPSFHHSKHTIPCYHG
jgi:predicted nuclease of restriction endonuclease-like (RecB) superfamily